MKIQQLKFKNIQSLKGEHVIRFDLPPLSEAGLFAIIGQTGAGKSTILDVITLALFNKVPRFSPKGSESISKNEIEKTGSVMTHFTDDAYAEIEYTSQGVSYRSTWRISRARTGKLRDYEMTLASLPEERFLDLKKSEVPGENEKILGLTYDQFIRSILLSQGEFAKFLKSDEKERAKLLEDITGSQIYREIGKSVFERSKEMLENIKALKQEAQLIPLLTQEGLEEKKNVLDEGKSASDALTHQATNYISTIQKYEKWQELKAQKLKNTEAQQVLKTRLSAFEDKALLLQKHIALEPHRDKIRLYQHELKRKQSLLIEKKSLTDSKIEVEASLKSSLETLSKFLQKEVHIHNFAVEANQFEIQIHQYDDNLKQLEVQGISVRSKLNQIFQQFTYDFILEIKVEKSPQLQWKTATEIQQKIHQLPIAFEGTEEALNTTMIGLREELSQLHKKANDFEKYYQHVEENKEFSNQLELAAQELSNNSLQLQNLKLQVENINQEIETTIQKKEHQLKIASLSEYRSLLVDDTPCPLCGALDHPYSGQEAISMIGELEVLLYKLQEQKALQTQEIQKTTSTIAVIESNISALKQRSESNQVNILQLQSLYKNIEDPSILKAQVEKNEALFDLYVSESQRRQSKYVIDEICETLVVLNQVSSDYLAVKQLRNQKYTGAHVHQDILGLTKAVSDGLEKQNANTVSFSNLIKNLNEVDQMISETSTDLSNELSKLGYINIEDAISYILEDQVMQEITLEKQTLSTAQTELLSTAQHIDQQIFSLPVEDIKDLQLKDLNESLIASQNKKEAILQSMGSVQNEIQQHHQNVDRYDHIQSEIEKINQKNEGLFYLNYLIGDATGSKYAKFAQNLSLKQLIKISNQRLLLLTDRYLLVESDIEEDMCIIDLYQGNTQRSVRTLSGGETFIVSLALALSLADMASKNVKLESLFIDEGFGTLDHETLETALLTLEKLQNETNRTIGIISHVDSLKERITTQIQVKKNNLGFSVIEVI